MTTIGSGLSEVTIPSLSDPANIQDAFKLYHWGSTSIVGTPSATSIAGKIIDLNTRIDGIATTATSDLTNDSTTNLNTLITTNNYKKLDAPNSGLNYPVVVGSTFTGPGFLAVVRTTKNSLDYVLQTYYMYDIPANTGVDGQTTALFWRSGKIVSNITTWGIWQQATTTSALSALKSTVDAKQALITGAATTITTANLSASKALISNVSGKVDILTTVSSADLGYLAGISTNTNTTGTVVNLLANKANLDLTNVSITSARTNLSMPVVYYSAGAQSATPTQNKIIFVQSAQPTAGTATAGDLWFW